jgi:dihydroxy-acid dehydratase
MIAAARYNRPTIIVYGGAMLPGTFQGNCEFLGKKAGDDINIGDPWEALGGVLTGHVDLKVYDDLVEVSNTCISSDISMLAPVLAHVVACSQRTQVRWFKADFDTNGSGDLYWGDGHVPPFQCFKSCRVARYAVPLSELTVDKQRECAQTGGYMRKLLERDIKPCDIMTKAAFVNAITIMNIMGGE